MAIHPAHDGARQMAVMTLTRFLWLYSAEQLCCCFTCRPAVALLGMTAVEALQQCCSTRVCCMLHVACVVYVAGARRCTTCSTGARAFTTCAHCMCRRTKSATRYCEYRGTPQQCDSTAAVPLHSLSTFATRRTADQSRRSHARLLSFWLRRQQCTIVPLRYCG